MWIKNEELRCRKCGLTLNHYHDEIVWNASGHIYHRYCLKKPSNLAKPNAQPALSDGADEGLKSCPYCGGSNLTEFNGRIECEGCGAHGPDEQSGVGWNDRAFV